MGNIISWSVEAELGICEHWQAWKQTFIPTQAATSDFTVCWIPSLHREQEAMSVNGPRAALMAVGAKSVGKIRVASKFRYVWSEGAYLGGHPKLGGRRLGSKRS